MVAGGIVGQNEEVPLAPPDLRCLDPKLPTPGQSIAGVDGCKRGWVMVRRDEAGQFDEPVIAKCLDSLPLTGMVIIDVPIGLPESGRRACDLEARTRLGRRWMTVFTGARRPLLSMASWEEANVWGKQDGEGVTKQLFGILPKIREVDAYIASARNLTFREGHPELSFYAAAGRPMEYNKKKAEGRDERLAALTSFIHGTMVREWLDRTRGSGAARDDILDALALCRSAARLALGCHGTLPAAPPRDTEDLAMEMVF